MGRFVVFLGLAYLASLIAAIADCLGGEGSPRRFSRGVWVLIIVLLPILGAVAWFTSGRPRARPSSPGGSAGRRPVNPNLGPDDDPDFLRDLERRLRDEKGDR